MIKPESSKGVAFAHHSTKNLSLASKTQGAILPVMTNYKGTEASSPHGKLSEIVVAYSCGLDTSVIIRWLRENFGCEVVLFTVNVGQVPFGLTSFALNPDLQVVAPRREDSIEYDTREIFWRTNPVNGPMKDMYMMPVDPKDARDKPEYLDIWIFSGFPVSINGKELSPAYFLSELNDIGNCYRSGQIDLVESRLVGMKSRGVYNTSRGAVLTVASHEPEFLTLDKDNLVHKSLELVYAGRWFDPLWESIDAFMENITKTTTGSVTVKLYNRSVFVASRKSPCSLYVIRPMLLDSYAWMDCLGG